MLDLIALMQGLDSVDPSRRQRVALTERGAVPAATIVETLLGEDDLNVAGALQWSLARSVDDAMPHLVEALESPDESARHQAMAAVAKLKPAATEAILTEALRPADSSFGARRVGPGRPGRA